MAEPSRVVPMPTAVQFSSCSGETALGLDSCLIPHRIANVAYGCRIVTWTFVTFRTFCCSLVRGPVPALALMLTWTHFKL